MRRRTLVLRGLIQHRRALLGVAFGALVSSAVLVAALCVGDSVRATLARAGALRVGRAQVALASGERLFRAELADEMTRVEPELSFAPALFLQGSARTSDGGRRANGLQVLGIDARFLAMAHEPSGARPPLAGEALLSPRLARQLGLSVGDEFVLRLERPSALSRELVIAPAEELAEPARVRFAGLVGDGDFGRFALTSGQVPPLNVVLELDWLQSELGEQGRANLLIAGGAGEPEDALGRASAALETCWRLDDAGLETRLVPERAMVELRSRGIFLGEAVAVAAAQLEPAPLGVLTWFVNSISHEERSAPYSSVSAMGALAPGGSAPEFLPDGLGAGELVVNDWLAADLEVGAGDQVELAYFALGVGRRLEERRESFKIAGVVPLAGAAADPELMPDFPGIAESPSCREWAPGMPVDLAAIREQDERYWQEHRGTPKAFLSLDAGSALWAGPHGSLTALRVPERERSLLEVELRSRLSPGSLGLVLRDIATPALEAAAPATDFGGLFLGLSLFLQLGALLLSALLFAFAVESRGGEIGLLQAVGFRRGQVRRLFLAEGVLVACAGALPGALLGLGLCALVLRALSSIWSGAVGEAQLVFTASPWSVLGGLLGAILMASLASFLTLLGASRRSAVELLAGSGSRGAGALRPRRALASLILCVALGGAAALVVGGRAHAGGAALAFFGAGALLLLAGLCVVWLRLSGMAHTQLAGVGGIGALARSGAARRPWRSLTTAASLALGVFLVVAVGANRLGPPDDPLARASGTGGFALWAEASVAVPHDLDRDEGRAAFGLESEELRGVSTVSLRVRNGDDASCLNLGTPQAPRLVGVDPDQLAQRGAFTFAALQGPRGVGSPWLELERDLGPQVVPGIIDAASLQWTLHRSLGDELEYLDERGRPFRVRIVGTLSGSILQGDVLIDAERFRARYPAETGFRRFLVDVPPERLDQTRAALSRGLADVGLAVMPTSERLAELQAVQNTYIAVFQALGALGLLLGSAGLLAVILRTALERHRELAVLRAVGFSRALLRSLIAREHLLILGQGLVVGGAAALLALWPAATSAGGGLEWRTPLVFVLLLAMSGVLWVLAAAGLATRGPIEHALRRD